MEWLIIGAAVIIAIVVGTVIMTRRGFNVRALNCPQCGTTLPTLRKPTSLRQALWGGWTCASCGCETDKWGRRA